MTTTPLLEPTSQLNFGYDSAVIASLQASLQLQPDKRRAVFLAEKMRVDFVFHTAALEGNPITFPEVQTLLDGITVGGRKVSDAEQVLNLNQSLSYVLQSVKTNDFTLDKKTACAIQGIVARHEALIWGEFRDQKVFISGTEYEPPAAQDLDLCFDKGLAHLLAESDPVLRAFLVFLWGSINQFFDDGNKRTSRLLCSGVLMMHGLPPLMLLSKDQLIYNQTMKDFYDTQDATPALTWLYGYYQARIAGFGFEQTS